MSDAESGERFDAHAPHLAALLLRSSLTHPRMGSLRSSAQPHDLGHLAAKSLAAFGITHLGWQVTLREVCWSSRSHRDQVAAQSFMVPSADAVTRRLPSGDQVTDQTVAVWAASRRRGRRPRASQMPAGRSEEAE